MRIATRVMKLPPYLFVQIDRARRQAIRAGRDVIDFGIGDPDRPTPSHIIRALKRAVDNPATHRYALDQGMPALRKEIANWYKRRFKVKLDFENEILPLIGSKEGIAHFPLAVINPGDYSLIPDPCYPPYRTGTILAGGLVYSLPLLSKNNFLPDLEKIPNKILKKAKLLYINYPNNPTAAVAGKEFYKEVVRFARRQKLVVVSDLAYSEICFDNFKVQSFLETEGAKNIAIEFHSLSKTYNMTGWRVGWAAGRKDLVAALAKVKANIDSGIFTALQLAGIAALRSSQFQVKKACGLYQTRRDILAGGLNSLGWQVTKPRATFYLWVRIPQCHLKINPRLNSMLFAQMLLKKAGIIVTPGVGFGKYGEGYVRFALTVDKKRIKQAISRLGKL
ncbi:MAG: LL-diaminopimelate aminotransferase [Candidatus Omnitrophica bacterium]|nr:LL-diaminopimelate aminotransferase [Candidatus Omnitrophota bacterium]MBU1871307.1 LL-diaminopimelate aminotransferase [Candidatus Omnitrophota bacterium]